WGVRGGGARGREPLRAGVGVGIVLREKGRAAPRLAGSGPRGAGAREAEAQAVRDAGREEPAPVGRYAHGCILIDRRAPVLRWSARYWPVGSANARRERMLMESGSRRCSG